MPQSHITSHRVSVVVRDPKVNERSCRFARKLANKTNQNAERNVRHMSCCICSEMTLSGEKLKLFEMLGSILVLHNVLHLAFDLIRVFSQRMNKMIFCCADGCVPLLNRLIGMAMVN